MEYNDCIDLIYIYIFINKRLKYKTPKIRVHAPLKSSCNNMPNRGQGLSTKDREKHLEWPL